MHIELQFITDNKIKIKLKIKNKSVLLLILFKIHKNFFLIYIRYKKDLNNNIVIEIRKKIVK